MFHEGFFRTIDDVTTVRISYLFKEFQRGLTINNFPVRIGAEMAHTYGYFFYLFYSPLVYYIGALMMKFGHLSDIVATKAVYALPLIYGPLLFYWCARIKLNKIPSIISTIFFAFFPYRGFDAYFRGGVGENWAIALLPGLFAGIFLLEKKTNFGPIIISFFLALIVISHNISALLVLTLVATYSLFFHLKNTKLWLSLLLGLGLASFFFIPSIYYLSLIRANTLPLNTSNILSSLIPMKNLLALNLEYKPSQAFSTIFFYLISGSILYFIFNKKMTRTYRKNGLFWLIGSIFLYLLMAIEFSVFWKMSMPVTRMLQFAWRVLILLSFSIPYSIGLVFNKITSRMLKVCVFLLVIYLSWIFSVTFKPNEYSYYYAYNIEDTGPCATADFEDYFPTWVEVCINKKPDNDMFLTKPGNLTITENNLIKMSGNYESSTVNTIILNRYYFPGWTVMVDDKEMLIDHTFSKSGLIEAQMPAGDHKLTAKFIKTNIMWLSDIITLVSILIWFSLLINYTYAIKKTL